MKRSPAAAWLTSLVLLATLCAGLMLGERRGHAQSNQGARARHLLKLSHDLNERAQGAQAGAASRLDCVLQLNGNPSGRLNALLNRNGIHLRAHFRSFNSYNIELPAGVLEELSSFEEVAHISLNNQVESLGHVSATTGADVVRSLTGKNAAALDGTGIGIAILDSGIDSSHKSFLDKANSLRIAAARDFTGENRTDDPYG
ncbi:MAG TPA: hypothetical protein VE842_01870, partial [Pyrinomonadaceae bacterium]|nr:hypothetical protein [Pyrinomonadaceae bacterium]